MNIKTSREYFLGCESSMHDGWMQDMAWNAECLPRCNKIRDDMQNSITHGHWFHFQRLLCQCETHPSEPLQID